MKNNQKIIKNVDCEKISRLIEDYIRASVGHKGVIIGLSGGIDSALTCALAARALGPKKVKVIIIKNVRYSDESLSIARGLAEQLGVERVEVDSNNIREQFLSKIDFDQDNVRQVSTLDARITDLFIRTIASMEERIYLGTINGTERFTGWYPKGSLFGDFCPIAGLLKYQIQEVAKYLGLPDGIVNSVSKSADRICSGCGELPEFKDIPYGVLDSVLYLFETEPGKSFKSKLDDVGIRAEYGEVILKRVEKIKNKSDVFCPFPIINVSN